MKQIQLEIRKLHTVKIGDTLHFCPRSEAVGGPEGWFFRKYDGMKATVRDFQEDNISTVGRILAQMAGGNQTLGKSVWSFYLCQKTMPQNSYALQIKQKILSIILNESQIS